MKLDEKILRLEPNVSKLSDQDLLEQTKFIADHERGMSILSLRHLREVEIRRAHLDVKCASMHAYCIKHLKYSEHETQTRLTSARLLKEIPEIESQVEEGSLNITNLSKLQTYFRSEKAANNELSREDKLAVLVSCENKPTRQLAKELIQSSQQPEVLAEKFNMTAVVMEDQSLNLDFVKFEALMNPGVQGLLKEFKDLYAHELADHSNITMLTFLLTKAVNEKRKKLGLQKHDAPLPRAPKVERQFVLQRNPISAPLRKLIWQRAGARCEHIYEGDGSRCDSTFALQPDHIVPVAMGGLNEAENLRLLCRAHNSRRAIKTFGDKWVRR